jgi:hypothetical protein
MTGRRDCAENTAGRRIDLLDAVIGQLEQMLAVECRSRMRGDIDRFEHPPVCWIEGAQSVSSGNQTR